MSNLFGTDGIRGTVGRWPLTPDFVLRIGQSLGKVLLRNSNTATVLVGRDTRSSGPLLQCALVSGLLASGVDVIDAGVIPTPAIAWLVQHLHLGAGVIVTASHNPVEENGIKCFGASGKKLTPRSELEIETLASANPGISPDTIARTLQIGRLVFGEQLSEMYVHGLLAEHPSFYLGGLTLVVDCANGAASRVAPLVFSRAGAQIIAIHSSPTGANINVSSGSEHTRREPENLAELIRRYHADFGLAFDGDADRVIFVDDQGGVVDGDHMLGLLARYFDGHDGRKGLLAGSVVTTSMCNTGLKECIKTMRLTLYETPVGDKYITEQLLAFWDQHPHPGMIGLGGEQAGHIILLDDEHSTGDGIRTALYLMRAYRETGVGAMSKFAAMISKTPQIIGSAYVGDGPRMSRKELDDLQEELLNSIFGVVCANLRYSGTEPQFRVMLESNGQQSVDDLGIVALKICRDVQSIAGIKDGVIDLLDCTRGRRLAY